MQLLKEDVLFLLNNNRDCDAYNVGLRKQRKKCHIFLEQKVPQSQGAIHPN